MRTSIGVGLAALTLALSMAAHAEQSLRITEWSFDKIAIYEADGTPVKRIPRTELPKPDVKVVGHHPAKDLFAIKAKDGSVYWVRRSQIRIDPKPRVTGGCWLKPPKDAKTETAASMGLAGCP